MKERPILFNAEMVRAVLDGSKTQTRRMVKDWQCPKFTENGSWYALCQKDRRYRFGVSGETAKQCAKELADWGIQPFGRVGDRLWVRETYWAYGDWIYRMNEKKGRYEWHFEDATTAMDRIYQFSDPTPSATRIKGDGNAWWKRPSIFMPRVARRITLEITAVRVERLQDITRSDIRSEGLQCPAELCSDDVSPNYRDWYPAAFRKLWESTGGDWNANPWVWVIEFKKLEQNT